MRLNPSTWKMKMTAALFLSECLRLKGVCGEITKIAMQCCRATYKLASLFHSQLRASIASNMLPGLSLDATNLDFFPSFLAVFMEIIDDKQEEMICMRERLLEPCLVISFIKVFVKLLSNYLRFIYLQIKVVCNEKRGVAICHFAKREFESGGVKDGSKTNFGCLRTLLVRVTLIPSSVKIATKCCYPFMSLQVF
ncbi:uncharacterized protein LOC131299868 [Rhododendron vialii]|uniref:uncharacterized protein LOC131299868 n=1 Tax=Rhododendron vialii TaxID=182163 RepID=UPI00265F08DB|nr:uncharacterized protein LOC131299868 [Rhododendron vialii]